MGAKFFGQYLIEQGEIDAVLQDVGSLSDAWKESAELREIVRNPIVPKPALKAAVDAGKHVFVEKPHAIDPAGVKMVRAACAKAKQKGLSVVSGLQSRYHPGYRETMQRVHDGAIGDVVARARDAFADAEILVVDDGSDDDTGATAEAAGAKVLKHPVSLGNGAAIKTGARAARGAQRAAGVQLRVAGQHRERRAVAGSPVTGFPRDQWAVFGAAIRR